MKIIRQVNWTYTLYEDENSEYVLDVVIPAPKGAWASYEKRVVLSASDKAKIKANPNTIDVLVQKIISNPDSKK